MIHQESIKHDSDPVGHPVPGLSVVQLRDYLLPEILPLDNTTTTFRTSNTSGSSSSGKSKKNTRTHNMHKDHIIDSNGRTRWRLKQASRNTLWKKVSRLVLRNSSVRECEMDVKGDNVAVWMWVGSKSLNPKK
jgi:hypothetical protein